MEDADFTSFQDSLANLSRLLEKSSGSDISSTPSSLSLSQQQLHQPAASSSISSAGTGGAVDNSMQYAQKVMDYILRFHSEMEYLGLQAYKSAEEKERKIKALTAYSCKSKSQIDSLHRLVIKLSKEVADARDESAQANEALKTIRQTLINN